VKILTSLSSKLQANLKRGKLLVGATPTLGAENKSTNKQD